MVFFWPQIIRKLPDFTPTVIIYSWPPSVLLVGISQLFEVPGKLVPGVFLLERLFCFSGSKISGPYKNSKEPEFIAHWKVVCKFNIPKQWSLKLLFNYSTWLVHYLQSPLPGSEQFWLVSLYDVEPWLANQVCLISHPVHVCLYPWKTLHFPIPTFRSIVEQYLSHMLIGSVTRFLSPKIEDQLVSGAKIA